MYDRHRGWELTKRIKFKNWKRFNLPLFWNIFYSYQEETGQTASQFFWVKFSECDSLLFTNSLGKDAQSHLNFSTKIILCPNNWFYEFSQLRLSCSVLFSLMQKCKSSLVILQLRVIKVSFNTSGKWAFQNTVCYRGDTWVLILLSPSG